MCDKDTLNESPKVLGLFLHKENIMQEKAMYFGKSDIYQKIRDVGGTWNDSKERPIICLIKSTEHDELYWAIPVGNLNHRDRQAVNRLNRYLSRSETDIGSCFYHIGKTTTDSIFFISDVIPITEKYIDKEYINRFTNNVHIVKNKQLISELERKLKRILAYENSNPNYFRQHITDIKGILISELNQINSIKIEEQEEQLKEMEDINMKEIEQVDNIEAKEIDKELKKWMI